MAEAHSLSGMKRNARQSFHVSASRAAGSVEFPVIPSPHSAFLTANEKDFSLSLEMTMREGGMLPPSPWKEAVRRGGGSLPPRDERECETALSRIVIPSAV